MCQEEKVGAQLLLKSKRKGDQEARLFATVENAPEQNDRMLMGNSVPRCCTKIFSFCLRRHQESFSLIGSPSPALLEPRLQRI